MGNEKKDTQSTPAGDRQSGQKEQVVNQPAGQKPSSQTPPGKSDSDMEEALKHVGHRGGKVTDFGSTSYEEDAE